MANTEIKHLRKRIYQMKIMGVLWFHGDLPTSAESEVTFYMNPKYAPRGQGAFPQEEYNEISELDESELEEKCREVAAPEYVNPREGTHISMQKLLDSLK